MERTYTDEQLEEMKAKPFEFEGKMYDTYTATQKQRQMERTIRKLKREMTAYEAVNNKEKLTAASIKWRRITAKYKTFSKKAGLTEQKDRMALLKSEFSSETAKAGLVAAQEHHSNWLHDIGAEATELNIIDKYYNAMYNHSTAHKLLIGYNRAVNKGDISPLVGYETYESIAKEIEEKLIGITTIDGITIEDYATHFIDRVIGQTADKHSGMRQGVPIDMVIDALQNGNPSPNYIRDNDLRRKYIGNMSSAVISLTDKKLIQANRE